jgi:hypothetical protein
MLCLTKHCNECKPFKPTLDEARRINCAVTPLLGGFPPSNGSTEYHPEQLTQHPEFETFSVNHGR